MLIAGGAKVPCSLLQQIFSQEVKTEDGCSKSSSRTISFRPEPEPCNFTGYEDVGKTQSLQTFDRSLLKILMTTSSPDPAPWEQSWPVSVVADDLALLAHVVEGRKFVPKDASGLRVHNAPVFNPVRKRQDPSEFLELWVSSGTLKRVAI